MLHFKCESSFIPKISSILISGPNEVPSIQVEDVTINGPVQKCKQTADQSPVDVQQPLQSPHNGKPKHILVQEISSLPHEVTQFI